MKRYILFVLFLCIHWVAWGETGYEYRYWFDNDERTMQTGVVSNVSLHIDADLSGLDVAMHSIHLQVKNVAGVWSAPLTRHFIKMPAGTEGCTYHYWLDHDDEHKKVGKFADGIMMLDVADAEDGLHILHLQAVGNGSVSSPLTRMFIKVPQTDAVDYLTCVCNIDGMLYRTEKVSAHGGVVDWSLDVAGLEQGLHRMQVQVLTPSGAATGMSDHFFFRSATQAEIDGMKLLYNVDGESFTAVKGSGSGGIFHFDLDVSTLEDGLHSLTYMLASETGTATKVSTSFFVKIPLGGYGITSYRYWLNENEAEAKTVKLATRANPFSLVSLLPVENCPIRSSCFLFTAEDGKPMVYAKNDIHFQFIDASKRIAEATKQYVDYSTAQEVGDIAELNTTQTFSRPQANGIQWFKFEAERGDSVTFKSNIATTIQLFDKNGDFYYEAKGAESVEPGGTHIMENGTYYLAIHDVMGSRNDDIKLEFQHISKFELLRTSNANFGVMPCVQILDVEGNGFDNLKSALLRMGDSVITVDSIACHGKADARLYMMFDGDEKYGQYDLVLNFDNGEEKFTITRNRYVNLSTPDFKTIDINIIASRTSVRPYPVSIVLTNKSNISYQAIPFCFAIDHIENVTDVKYLNFAVECDKELYDNGVKLSFEYDDFRGNNSNTRVVPVIIPELLPGESITLKLGIQGNLTTIFKTYAWTGIPWNMKCTETTDFINNMLRNGKKRAVTSPIEGVFNGCGEDPCDYAGGLAECTCATGLSLGGTLGGIQLALQNRHNNAMRNQLAQSGLFDDPYEYFPDHSLPSPSDLAWYWLQHCLQEHAAEFAENYNEIRHTTDNDNTCPGANSQTCSPFAPSDPNNMHGFVSESGSKYVNQSVTDVSYSIEFENDPEHATAAAHFIEVTDTLDATLFDLASFKPTAIRIGNRRLELDGKQNFVKTIDMRPQIDVIAQIILTYDQNVGIAQWTISSLDPMTMEESYDFMQGVLPVNNDGDGIGFIDFDICLKKPLEDGDSFSNCAGIVFDSNATIMTPTWTNIVDAVAPESDITDVVQGENDSIRVFFKGNDNLSGIWKYDIYAQAGKGNTWNKIAECGADSSYIDFYSQDVADYGFCVIATDFAGNIEHKTLSRHGEGDMNGDGRVDIGDVVVVLNVMAGNYAEVKDKADVNGDGRVDIGDCVKILGIMANSNKQ